MRRVGALRHPDLPRPAPACDSPTGRADRFCPRAAVSEITERLLGELETCASVTSPNTPSSVRSPTASPGGCGRANVARRFCPPGGPERRTQIAAGLMGGPRGSAGVLRDLRAKDLGDR